MELVVYYNAIDTIKLILDPGVDLNAKKHNHDSPVE